MQGAALGAGAAVGSSMVHGAMNMMSGSGKEQQQTQPPANNSYAAQPQQTYQTSAPGQQAQNPCGAQLQDFLSCTQNQSDLSLCTAFNDVYKQCKMANGMP